MKIDGYTPPSKDVALDQGVTFEYELPFGSISITSKMAGRDNVQWRLASANYEKWAARRSALAAGKDDVEADRRFIGIQHDHLVIAWSTTIKSDGTVIEPSRENFIELMLSDACRRVLIIYLQDAADETNFTAVTEEELGNSARSSDTGSDGLKKSSSGSGK